MRNVRRTVRAATAAMASIGRSGLPPKLPPMAATATRNFIARQIKDVGRLLPDHGAGFCSIPTMQRHRHPARPPRRPARYSRDRRGGVRYEFLTTRWAWRSARSKSPRTMFSSEHRLQSGRIWRAFGCKAASGSVNRWERLVYDSHFFRRLCGQLRRLCDHQRNRLPRNIYLSIGEHGLVSHPTCPTLFSPGDVLRSQYGNDARHGTCFGCINVLYHCGGVW